MKTYEQATLWSVDKFFCARGNKAESIGMLTETVMAMVRLEMKSPDINEQMVLNTLTQMTLQGYLSKNASGLYSLPGNVYVALQLLGERSERLLPGYKAEMAQQTRNTLLLHEAAQRKWNPKRS